MKKKIHLGSTSFTDTDQNRQEWLFLEEGLLTNSSVRIYSLCRQLELIVVQKNCLIIFLSQIILLFPSEIEFQIFAVVTSQTTGISKAIFS